MVLRAYAEPAQFLFHFGEVARLKSSGRDVVVVERIATYSTEAGPPAAGYKVRGYGAGLLTSLEAFQFVSEFELAKCPQPDLFPVPEAAHAAADGGAPPDDRPF